MSAIEYDDEGNAEVWLDTNQYEPGLRDTLFTSTFDETQARNEQALTDTQTRLAELRLQVKETYAEIKTLVADEAALKRMVAVGKKRHG